MSKDGPAPHSRAPRSLSWRTPRRARATRRLRRRARAPRASWPSLACSRSCAAASRRQRSASRTKRWVSPRRSRTRKSWPPAWARRLRGCVLRAACICVPAVGYRRRHTQCTQRKGFSASVARMRHRPARRECRNACRWRAARRGGGGGWQQACGAGIVKGHAVRMSDACCLPCARLAPGRHDALPGRQLRHGARCCCSCGAGRACRSCAPQWPQAHRLPRKRSSHAPCPRLLPRADPLGARSWLSAARGLRLRSSRTAALCRCALLAPSSAAAAPRAAPALFCH